MRPNSRFVYPGLLPVILILAGCPSPINTFPVGDADRGGSERAARLARYVENACGWVPVLATLGSLVPGYGATADRFERVANDICKQVLKTPSAAVAGAPMTVNVNGVEVTGRFN